MSKLTRKTFFEKTSAGAAVAGMFAVVPGLAAHAAEPTMGNMDLDTSEPFLVYVRNPKAGELVLMVGGREIRYHDPELVARLWQVHARTSHHPTR